MRRTILMAMAACVSVGTLACKDDGGGTPDAAVQPPDAGGGAGGGADAGGGAAGAAGRDAGAAGAAGSGGRDGGAGGAGGMAAACPSRPDPFCEPDLKEALVDEPMKVRHCALDLGSNTVKIVVASMVPKEPSTIDGKRSCKRQLGLRDRASDAMTKMPRAIQRAELADLFSTVKEYLGICERDKAPVLGAVATQWARTVTNAAEIAGWLKAETGVDMKVLTPEEEALFGYFAATNGAAGRIVLDAGGGSFQLSYMAKDDKAPAGFSVPLGHNAAFDAVFSKHETYAAARTAYVAELKKLIAAKPETQAAWDKLKALVAAGSVEKELASLGDSGVILAVQGKLQDGAGKWVDEATYDLRMAERRALVMPGPKELMVGDMDAFLDRLAGDKASFDQLRECLIRRTYGNKVLGHLLLMSTLIKELGLAPRVVFRSGEMAEGYVLDRAK